jgi:hypothetical protein
VTDEACALASCSALGTGGLRRAAQWAVATGWEQRRGEAEAQSTGGWRLWRTGGGGALDFGLWKEGRGRRGSAVYLAAGGSGRR